MWWGLLLDALLTVGLGGLTRSPALSTLSNLSFIWISNCIPVVTDYSL